MMADVEKKDEALKDNLPSEEDAPHKVINPENVSSTSITIMEKIVVGSGGTDTMEELEKVKNEGNAKIEGLKIDEDENKDNALTEGEKDAAQAVMEDSVRGEDEEKTEEKINGEILGEGSKRKNKKPRRRNKKMKLAQEASVTMDGDKVNATVAANNGLTIDEEHNKEKAIGKEGTQEADAVKEASVDADGEKTKGLKMDEGSNKEKALTEGEKDEKTQEQINQEKLGESSKRKRRPRKRNRKKKIAEKTSEIIARDGVEANVTVAAKNGLMVDEAIATMAANNGLTVGEANVTMAANSGLTVDEGHTKEKAIGEEKTPKEDAVKEASVNGIDELKTEEKKNGERLEEGSKGKGRRPRKRNKKKKVVKMVSVDGDKPESSSKKKDSKMVESMGMIFMCSSKTKADCFHYKILGLPAGKKDQVAKIYKGMRLFLFDVELRLMYGIFKAEGAGGYNIEPKAFKSAFPSQVRFTINEDCLPLPEEKFKTAIKENYYARNKFDSQLNAQQVKNLCRLFKASGKSKPSPKKDMKNRGNRALGSTGKDRQKRKRRVREDEMEPHPPEPRRYHGHGHGHGQGQTPVIYERADPGPRYLPLSVQDPGPVRSYGYERTYSYARDPVLDHGSYHRVLDSRDHYPVYSREAEPPIYRDSLYSSLGQTVEYHRPTEYHLLSREYHPPTVLQPPEYHLSGGGSQVPSYRSAASLSEYRPYGTRYGY